MATQGVTPEERISALEHETRELRAQLESERINSEQASLVIEERYTKLADEYGTVCAERETAHAECASLREMSAKQKKEAGALDVRIIELEKEVERKKVEVRELHTDKQGILQLLQQRKAEIGEYRSMQEGGTKADIPPGLTAPILPVSHLGSVPALARRKDPNARFSRSLTRLCLVPSHSPSSPQPRRTRRSSRTSIRLWP